MIRLEMARSRPVSRRSVTGSHPRSAAFETARRWLPRLAEREGLALIATLLLITLVAVLTTSAITGVMSSMRAAGADYQDTRVFYAAEAGGEATIAQLQMALADGYLSDSELAGFRPPTLDGISFDSFTVSKVGAVSVEKITDGPFAGLSSLTQNVDIYSRATTSQGDMSAVVLRTKAQAIPIFQFGVFFEQDLEATNGPPMEFFGRVHSNGNIYLSSDNAWYRDLLTTPNKIFHDRKDFHSVKNGVFINDAAGAEVALDFDSRSHPDPDAFKAASCAQVDCRVMTDAFGVDTLRLPLPKGVPAYELIRPREVSDVEAERKVKYSWNADMYVTVDLRDIRTKDAVCGGITPPDHASGEVTIIPLNAVYPGQAANFVATHPLLSCADFDGRAVLKVKSSLLDYSTAMSGCNFTVNIPAGDLANLSIEIWLDGSLYAQLKLDQKGKVWWHLSQLVETAATWPMMTIERTGGLEVPTPADMCKIFQWEWSDFYDGRDKVMRDALNFDINELTAWVNGNASRRTEITYIEFKLPADIAGYGKRARGMILDATIDPATRVIGGVELPNRMSISSEWPFYIVGDYNVINKKPAAVAGDGLTVLSAKWLDEDNQPLSGGLPLLECVEEILVGKPCNAYVDWANNFWVKKNAAETTVNAAILAGHWPTPCDHEDAACPADGTSTYYQDWYGGGLENFPRFLEHWYDAAGNRQTMRYRGSLVSPFTSSKTTGTWNGLYYTPPARDWYFDTDFQNPQLLPPGTPSVGFVIRTAMREAS